MPEVLCELEQSFRCTAVGAFPGDALCRIAVAFVPSFAGQPAEGLEGPEVGRLRCEVFVVFALRRQQGYQSVRVTCRRCGECQPPGFAVIALFDQRGDQRGQGSGASRDHHEVFEMSGAERYALALSEHGYAGEHRQISRIGRDAGELFGFSVPACGLVPSGQCPECLAPGAAFEERQDTLRADEVALGTAQIRQCGRRDGSSGECGQPDGSLGLGGIAPGFTPGDPFALSQLVAGVGSRPKKNVRVVCPARFFPGSRESTQD